MEMIFQKKNRTVIFLLILKKRNAALGNKIHKPQ